MINEGAVHNYVNHMNQLHAKYADTFCPYSYQETRRRCGVFSERVYERRRIVNVWVIVVL